MSTKTLSFPTLTKEHPLERLALRILIALVAALIFSYIYFIAASTFHIIARKQAETTGVAVQSASAQMNAEYYNLTAGLSPETASSMGLKSISKKEYVTRSIYLGYADTRTR